MSLSVTSFPHITRTYFEDLQRENREQFESIVETPINYVSGSVEAAVGLGLADAVVDLVETGTTMKAAGLDIVTEIMKTEAVLLGNPKSKRKDLIDTIMMRLDGHMTAQRYAYVCCCWVWQILLSSLFFQVVLVVLCYYHYIASL